MSLTSFVVSEGLRLPESLDATPTDSLRLFSSVARVMTFESGIDTDRCGVSKSDDRRRESGEAKSSANTACVP